MSDGIMPPTATSTECLFLLKKRNILSLFINQLFITSLYDIHYHIHQKTEPQQNSKPIIRAVPHLHQNSSASEINTQNAKGTKLFNSHQDCLWTLDAKYQSIDEGSRSNSDAG